MVLKFYWSLQLGVMSEDCRSMDGYFYGIL